MEAPALQVELDECVMRTIDRQQEARGVNTNQAYQPKQREYKVWCERKGYNAASVHQVTATKLNLFLHEEVLDRTFRKKNATNKVCLSNVAIYVAAITDLYSDQRARGCNSHPHRQDSVVSSLLSTMKREKHNKAKQNYADRGVGSLLDGYYTTEELERMSAFYMGNNTGEGLRNRMSHLLCHLCILRGESARNLELPEIFL